MRLSQKRARKKKKKTINVLRGTLDAALQPLAALLMVYMVKSDNRDLGQAGTLQCG